MQFYLMVYRDTEVTKFATIGKIYYLPKVRHPLCGHETNATGAVPVAIPADGANQFALREADKLLMLSFEEWDNLEDAVHKYLLSITHSEIPVSPGMRFGPLHTKITYRKRPPLLVEATPYLLYNAKLIQLFVENKLTGFNRYPAKVELTKDSEQTPSYYELLFFSQVSLSSQANVQLTTCPICHKVTRVEYQSLIVDQDKWDGSDFIRTPALRRELVSENVKRVIEAAGVTGAKFIPSEMLSAGPSAKSLTQVLAELEFDRQRGSKKAAVKGR